MTVLSTAAGASMPAHAVHVSVVLGGVLGPALLLLGLLSLSGAGA